LSRRSNVLVTCGGKWVGFVLQMKEAMLKVPELAEGKLMVASSEELTPAGSFADAQEIVPPIRDEQYVSALLDVCARRDIRVVIPPIDLDLERLAPNLGLFADKGVAVVCPSPSLLELCLDKDKFAAFAAEERLAYPKTYSAQELNQARYPLFFKKRRGFGSIGIGRCESLAEALELLNSSSDIILQEYVTAPEISVDAYIARDGRCTICVPRMRDKVVAGEAYRSHTVAPSASRDLALKTIHALSRRRLRGPLNVQLFESVPPCLVEVNTRLGSASVLSNVAARGRLYASVLAEACGGQVEGDPNDYEVGLSLYRFLGDVIHRSDEVVKMVPPRSCF
jgi:carbamoyl-phosphate synthase large subunit